MRIVNRAPRFVFVALCTAILLIAGFLLFYGLGNEPFQDFDESTYAEITHEALTSGNSLTFTYAGVPYERKPPLLFWLIEASEQVVPDMETAARLPSACAALLLVAAVMLIAWDVTRDRAAVLITGGILTTTSAFIEAARQVRFDTLVTLAIVIGTYAALRAAKDSRWLLLFGIAIGLGILAKGIIVFFALAPFAVILFRERRYGWFTDRYARLGAGIALLISLPWHILQTMHYGWSFWQEYVGNQVIARIGSDILGTSLTNWGYATYLYSFAFPWVAFAVYALLYGLWRVKRMGETERVGFLSIVLTLTAMILVYGATQTKAVTYLVPLYPFIALLIGLEAASLLQARVKFVRWATVVIFAVSLSYGLYLSAYNGLHVNPYYYTQITIAEDEHAIARIVAAQPTLLLYSYKTDALGTIKFYSQRLLIYGVENPSALTAPGLIILNSSNLPLVPGAVLYHGLQVSLVQFYP